MFFGAVVILSWALAGAALWLEGEGEGVRVGGGEDFSGGEAGAAGEGDILTADLTMELVVFEFVSAVGGLAGAAFVDLAVEAPLHGEEVRSADLAVFDEDLSSAITNAALRLLLLEAKAFLRDFFGDDLLLESRSQEERIQLGELRAHPEVSIPDAKVMSPS